MKTMQKQICKPPGRMQLVDGRVIKCCVSSSRVDIRFELANARASVRQTISLLGERKC